MLRHLSLTFALVLSFGIAAVAQGEAKTHRISVEKKRKETTVKYSNVKESPLLKTDIATFEGLNYFPVDFNYCVEARIEIVKGKKFKMQTSTDRTPVYKTYAKLYFTIDGKEYVLNAYQNVDLIKKEGFEDYLFVPFTDKTSGEETYGGGRYIDLRIPAEGNTVTLDFNLSYNPYCAYNHNYSCPIPPMENFVPIRVEAGEMKFHDDH